MDHHPCWLQSCAWAGCGANEAQAPAAGEFATQHGLKSAHARVHTVRTFLARESCLSRNAVKASSFARVAGSPGAGDSAQPNAVAIAPQPARAQLCREVIERKLESDPN